MSQTILKLQAVSSNLIFWVDNLTKTKVRYIFIVQLLEIPFSNSNFQKYRETLVFETFYLV